MKYPLLIRVLQDVLADKTRKRISPQEISTYCEELAEIIRQAYDPTLIAAIGTGGSVPGELLAQALSVPVVHFVIRRDITISRRYNLDPIPIRWIMSIYHYFLFQTIKPTVSEGINMGIFGEKVLIVDDMLHTGATIDVAIEYLRKAGVSEIKTASLGYVSEREPDFSVLPAGNYCFPWSKDF